ncbi:hypothetical protein [Luteococcus sp.]|uniref:hypothetical protein n=1 Tax=Luteococcus sp. TaxID=1969402 RepID=UPI003736CB26
MEDYLRTITWERPGVRVTDKVEQHHRNALAWGRRRDGHVAGTYGRDRFGNLVLKYPFDEIDRSHLNGLAVWWPTRYPGSNLAPETHIVADDDQGDCPVFVVRHGEIVGLLPRESEIRQWNSAMSAEALPTWRPTSPSSRSAWATRSTVGPSVNRSATSASAAVTWTSTSTPSPHPDPRRRPAQQSPHPEHVRSCRERKEQSVVDGTTDPDDLFRERIKSRALSAGPPRSVTFYPARRLRRAPTTVLTASLSLETTSPF